MRGFTLGMHNWSDVDSKLPGAPTPLQSATRARNVNLAQDIFDAYMLVQRAKKF